MNSNFSIDNCYLCKIDMILKLIYVEIKNLFQSIKLLTYADYVRVELIEFEVKEENIKWFIEFLAITEVNKKKYFK